MEGIKLFSINSKDRLAHSRSSTDAIFQFNAYNATSVEVISFQMPMCQYNIDSTNNNVFFNDGSNRTFTITPGNYSIYDLLPELQSKFNTVSANYTVTYSDVSMRITITGLLPFRFLFATNLTNTSAYILGFNNTDGVLALSQTSDNSIDLSLPLFVCCDVTQFDTNVKSTDDTSSTFIFPNKVNGGDILSFSEMTDFKQCSRVIEPNIQNLCIRFSFPGNRNFSINNVDWMMALRLHYCR